MNVVFDVLGTPKPQGSKRAFLANGHAQMKEAGGLDHAAWRNAVADKARTEAALHGALSGPLYCAITFRFPMPKSRPKAIQAAGWAHKTAAPDIDKLCRALFDGLQAGGLIPDDALIVRVMAQKFETTSWTGAAVSLHTATGEKP